MDILVICQHYAPEPFRIAEICEALVQKGHNVDVVTGTPNYPMGVTYKGYEDAAGSNEVINGVNIHRCYTIPRKTGILFRFLNYYSFAISSSHYIKQLKKKYDVIFVNQLTPVMMANAGCVYKKKTNTPLLIYCLDLWPESLSWGGIKRGSLIYNYYHHLSENIYKNADIIATTSKEFNKYFYEEFKLKNTVYLPQFADDLFSNTVNSTRCDNIIKLVFAGNIGVAQSLETVVRAAQKTQDLENLEWHIYGDGSELQRLKNMVKGLSVQRFFFHGRYPVEEMPAVYADADAMLLTLQRKDILSYTLPGKLQTYMAAGKPIIGAIDGEAATVIKVAECGLCGAAEDAEELENNVRKFINSKDKKRMGYNARKYYVNEFSKINFINNLVLLFEKIQTKHETY